MLWRVKDILPVISPHLGANGLAATADCLTQNPRAVREALEAYNRINEIFMNRQDWPGTEVDVCLTVCDGCLTLPARFESIKALSLDQSPGVRILPSGWEYLDNGPGINLGEGCASVEALHLLGRQFPTYRELPCPLPVGAYSSRPEQAGASLRLYGTDTNGHELRSPDGSPGWELPIAHGSAAQHPYMTPAPLASLTALSKPLTAGHVDVFGWDQPAARMVWLSRLDPTETSPAYSRYRLHGSGSATRAQARVSLAYRELWDLEEISLVQHREAYRLAAQALSAFDDMDGGKGSEFMNRAMRLLKDRVAKLEAGQRQGIHLNMSHRRPLRSPWRYSNR